MTDKQIAARILLTGIVLALGALPLLSSCAAFDHDGIIVAAGSSICTAPKNGECERLQRIADTLNTGRLAKDIEAARLR